MIVDHPIGMIPKNEVYAKVDKAYPDIIKAATQWTPGKENMAAQAGPYPAKTMKLKGTYSDVNDLFVKRKWSTGLPIVPPTPERVAAMLKGTDRKPDEVLWVVPPRQGMLTVELAATLGVMAGSKPEHMNLLIAAVEAMKLPEAAWRGTSTTTASTYPMFVISGPVIEKLGLNAGTGTAGGENPTTNALGHFVNLVGDVVGGSVPPNLDKTTHGSSADLVATVFVENAGENPWGMTFAEQMGFKKTDSVISLSTSYPPNGNIDHGSTTGRQLLNTFAAGIAGTASGIASCYSTYGSGDMTWYNNCNYVMMIVGPEHARTIQQDFKSIRAVQDYLLRETRLPYKAYAYETCNPPADILKSLTEDTLLPRFTRPESFKIIVTGGAGKQSQFWVPFPQLTKPACAIIKGY